MNTALSKRACDRCIISQQYTRRWRSVAVRASTDQNEQHVPAEAARILDSVRVVLVAPKTPANIGAVARCCANFEVTAAWQQQQLLLLISVVTVAQPT